MLFLITVGEMSSRSGSEGNGGSGDVADGKLCCPAIADNHVLPKAIFEVAPPSQDGFAIEGDFTTCYLKEYLAARVAQDGDGEEIVNEAGMLMS